MLDPPETFEEFFRREINSLVTFVRKLGFDLEDAKDAASQAMIKLYERWEQVAAPLPWVSQAAQRIALRNAENQRTGTVRAIQKWKDTHREVVAPPELIDGNIRVLALLDCLPPRQREVMAWHLNGFTTREIARVLEKSEATVRSTKRHALNQLRMRLEDLIQRRGEEGPGYGS